MLTILKANCQQKQSKELNLKDYETKDIIVNRVTWVEESKNPNEIIRKKIEKKVNLTKMINECKKIVKTDTAIEKVQKLQNELINKGVL